MRRNASLGGAGHARPSRIVREINAVKDTCEAGAVAELWRTRSWKLSCAVVPSRPALHLRTAECGHGHKEKRRLTLCEVASGDMRLKTCGC